VVDSGSTDDTMNIAYIWAEVLQFHWNGKFPKKRNWALQNANLLHEWIYFDADEFVSDEFVNEVAIKIQVPNYNGHSVSKLLYG
jgi:glycosyltransferase involved in cell wall biosynthesis